MCIWTRPRIINHPVKLIVPSLNQNKEKRPGSLGAPEGRPSGNGYLPGTVGILGPIEVTSH